jgi:hypothetical protein
VLTAKLRFADRPQRTRNSLDRKAETLFQRCIDFLSFGLTEQLLKDLRERIAEFSTTYCHGLRLVSTDSVE